MNLWIKNAARKELGGAEARNFHLYSNVILVWRTLLWTLVVRTLAMWKCGSRKFQMLYLFKYTFCNQKSKLKEEFIGKTKCTVCGEARLAKRQWKYWNLCKVCEMGWTCCERAYKVKNWVCQGEQWMMCKGRIKHQMTRHVLRNCVCVVCVEEPINRLHTSHLVNIWSTHMLPWAASAGAHMSQCCTKNRMRRLTIRLFMWKKKKIHVKKLCTNIIESLSLTVMYNNKMSPCRVHTQTHSLVLCVACTCHAASIVHI